ncbi:703_t:CDS:2 [Funneliformis geosporum]|uniref:2486_t:CDS:1 n=1 Tax=Funneliformis geosporum TaxID=1117311 RepID=A0A9W4SJ85_9GLOM|nr:2486_t:CDS:2 [Funneliformis geosporum]CAI2178794.1 703_t:CDS:2 [Funneliformis geosporum]
METYSNFDTSGLNSDSNEVDLNFQVYYIPINESHSQQRQTTNSNRNNGSATSSLVSTNLTSQNSHLMATVSSTYSLSNNMLSTPEGSDNNAVCPELIMSPYNMLPNSGHLTMEDTFQDDEFYFEPLESPALAESSGVPFLHNYIPAGLLSPQISPTLPPDSSMNITSNSPARRQSHKARYSPIKVSLNNNSMSQRRKPSFTNSNRNNNNNAITSIMTGSPNKFPSNNSITMSSLLELTSPLMNNMVETSIASSMQDTMPNLNLGSNLVSDVMNTHSSTNVLSNETSPSSFSVKIAPITPSSLMKLKKKQPNSPKSSQIDLKSNSQKQLPQDQQKKQEQSQQLQSISKDQSTFIAPTPPTQLNQIRTNMIATTGTGMSPKITSPILSVSTSGASGRKSMRSNPNASSPLALGPSLHSKSPHTLKPTISPNLKPKLPGVLADEVAEKLANKSNYRSILEGTAQSLGISYPSDVHSSLESRRTTHKAAEQKRRDSLKQSFDELKKVVPYYSPGKPGNGKSGDGKSDGKSSDGSIKNVSKLFLLKREKDEVIRKLIDELDELKGVKRQKIDETEKKKIVVDVVEDKRISSKPLHE